MTPDELTPEKIVELCDAAAKDWQDACDCGESTHAAGCAAWPAVKEIEDAKIDLELFLTPARARSYAAIWAALVVALYRTTHDPDHDWQTCDQYSCVKAVEALATTGGTK